MKSKTKKVTLVSLLASFVMAFACAFLPANVTAQAEDTQVTLAETTTNVAKIGETGYETFGAALTAANNMTGDVVVEIYDKVTLNQSLTGAYNSITFVGKTETAEIYSDIQGYITASKKVNFENLTLSKVAGGYLTDAGFMNLAFNVFGSEEVTYTNCIFVNGACASGAATTYTNCTFYRSHDRYGLWAYGSTEVTVEGCTFADFRGIKLFAEGKEQKTALTVTNTDFSKVNNKPAIVLTSGKSVTLAGNTYSETGVFELDLDGAPNGTPITSNQKITCVNDNGACGVLVDGKIYTTVAQAAEVATAESTVTLLHNSTETVELPEGVTLDKNGYTADGVTVKVPVPVVAKIGNVGYATLEEAFNAAVEGDKIVLCENATPALTSQRAITKAAVIDLNDYTLTLTEDDLYFGTTTFMNGTIVVDPSVRPSTAVFWMFANQTLTFDNVKLVATGVTGTYLIGLDGNNADLNLLNGSEIVVNNTTALDLDIICVNASTGNDIVVDNSKVTVTNLDGRVFFRGNYTISGASEVKLEGITKAGIRIEAGQTLTIADNAKVEIIGEPRDGGIHLTDATAVYVKEDTATVSATVNKPVAVVDGKSYATLKEAIAAVKEGETVTILAGTFEEGTIKLPATLKNVTFKADGKVVLKDMTISASDGNSYSYVDVTFDGIIFDNSRIIFTGWRNGEEIVENLTITNCKFININDTTNTAAVHINKDASEPVNGFTFKNNVIDGAVGGSKSGIYLQATGNVVVENNVINNVSFRPFVIQITTNDGVADEFVVTGNTFSGSAVGRAQGLGNDSTGTDTVNVAVTNNIFKDITDAQQICYWNFNAEKTTTDLSGNYYDIDIEANPNKIYYNSACASANDLYLAGVKTYYTGLNADGTIDTTSKVELQYSVAKVGDNYYATLEEAFKAATSGATIEILEDVTIDYYWDARYTGAKFTVPVTIDGNGHTIKFTNTVYDGGNYMSAFRFEADATVTDLTFDLSKAQSGFAGRVRAISAKANLTVDNCAFIGNTELTNTRAIIFGEGAGAAVANVEVSVTNCTFENWKQGVTDNENGQDAKSVSITSSTFENAGVQVSAHEEVTFTNNQMTNGWVNITSYTNQAAVKVTATGNTLEANQGKNVNQISVNPNNVEAEGFAIPVAVVGSTYYLTLQDAFNAGGEVKLLADVVVEDTLTIAEGKTITLELNGKTISQVKAQTAGYQMILNDGTLTINDTVGGGKISYIDSGNGGEYISDTIYNRSVLVINGGTIENLSSATVATNGYPHAVDTYSGIRDTSVTINGGTIYCAEYSAIRMFCVSDTYKADLVINGGTVKGAIDMQNGSKNAALGSLTITGGTFETTKNANNIRFANWNGGATEYGLTASVTGGTFNGGITTAYVPATATFNSNFIAGGTFAQDLSKFCAKGYTMEANDDGSYGVVEKGLNGSGTEADPYQIATAEDLFLFAEKVNDGTYKGVYVKLTANIDLNQEDWISIGTSANPFTGTFDGNGKTISNLWSYEQGLFGFTSTGNYVESGVNGRATIKNFTLNGAEVNNQTTSAVGAVVGQAGQNTEISGVTVTGYIQVYGYRFVGGIVGQGYVRVDNCKVIGEDNDGEMSEINAAYWAVAGIVGHAGSEGGSSITNCSVSNVKIYSTYYGAGAIAGVGTNGPIENVTAKSVVIEAYYGADASGFLVGCNYDKVTGNSWAKDSTLTVDGNEVVAPQDMVAKIGATYFATLQAAMEAVEDDQTIVLVADVKVTETLTAANNKEFTLDLNGKTISQEQTEMNVALLRNYAILTIQDSVGGGVITSKYVGAGDPSYGKGNYTIVNSGTLILDGVTVKNETAAMSHMFSAVDNNSTTKNAYLTVNGGTISTPNYRSIRQFANSEACENVVTVTANATIEGQIWVQSPNAKANKAKTVIESGTFSPKGGDASAVYFTTAGTAKFEAEVKGGTFNGKIGVDNTALLNGFVQGGTFTATAKAGTNEACLAKGFVFTENADGTYGVDFKPVLPNATVTNLGSISVEVEKYYIYDLIGGTGLKEVTKPFALQVAMDFKANDTAEEAANNFYGNYTTDFYIELTGIANGSFVGNDCYIAGYYPSFGAWVVIPLDGFTIENEVVYPVISSARFDFKYTDICGSVGQFICGIYLSEEVLKANPNLKVNLALGLSENVEAAQNAEFTTVDDYEYDAEAFVAPAAKVVSAENAAFVSTYATINEAIKAAKDGDTVYVFAGEYNEYVAPWTGDSTHKSEKSITIIGGKYGETILTNGMYLGYDDSGCRDHTIVVEGFTFKNKGILVAGQKNVTIQNNKFVDITTHVATTSSANANAISVIGKNINATITNNVIENVAVAGINLRDTATVTVTGNVVKNTGHNSITIQNNNTDGDVVITNNTLENWGLGVDKGRAVRTGGGKNVTITNNVMIHTKAPEEFVKSVNVAETLDASKNYWNGEEPTTAHFYVDGTGSLLTQVVNYYADKAMTEVVELKAYVAEVNGVGYASLAQAIAVGGEVKLLADIELTEGIKIATGKTVTLDLNGYTITGIDETEKSFSVFENKGEFTVMDSSEKKLGAITLKSKFNSGWDRYSSVVSNTVGGKFTLASGTLEHLGGTDMAYGIDNLTNGKGTYAETIVNGGTVKSPYRAIRQFLNGTEAQNILTVNGGVIEGANKAIWFQDPSKDANSGTLTVTENAKLYGDVFLSVTAGSTEWPVTVSVAEDAFESGTVTVNANVPAKYKVENTEGAWGVAKLSGFYGANLTVGVDLSFNFYIIGEYTVDTEATFTMKANTTLDLDEDLVQKVKPVAVTVDGIDMWKFTFKGVGPHLMGEKLLVEVVDGLSIEYSVADYIYKELRNEHAFDGDAEKLEVYRKFLVNTLNYGAESQRYFSAQNGVTLTDAQLISNGLDETEKSYITHYHAAAPTAPKDVTEAIEANVDIAKVVHMGAVNYIEILFQSKAGAANNATQFAGWKVVIWGNGHFGTEVDLVQSGTYGSWYSVLVEDILATEFNVNYAFVVYNAQNEVVAKISYSVQTYVYNKQNKTEAITPVAVALWNYYHAAEDYIDMFN